MKRSENYLALLLLVLALLACAAVVYFQWMINDAETAYGASVQNAQQSFTAQNSAVAMHAEAQDTASARQKLDALLSPDVASVAATLRGIGKTTGAQVVLGGALPESTPTNASGQSSLSAVSYSLEADGTFASLMRTLQLIETLPLPSRVERFDIQQSQGTSWHMSVSIRVLSTTISS